MKKKVLLVVRWPVGGIRTFLRYVYRNFDSKDWQFGILSPDLPEMRVLLEDDLADLDIRYIPVEGNPSLASFTLKVARELRNCKYDLVHSHGFTSGVCTAILAKLKRTRHLMTSHDVININQFLGAKGRVKSQVFGALLGMIDAIHSVSHDAEKNLLEFFPALSGQNPKCCVIPNGIEVERFRDASPRNLRDELGVGEDVFLIGFLGRFMAQKGFRYLVEAIEILSKDADLPKKPMVLTFGDGAFIREEKQAIKEKGVQEFFHFMPFNPNIAGTLKGLDVVAMPSLWEACGLLAMEAMVCGTPIIGTDCIGLREVLSDTPAVVVPKADASALANALQSEMLYPKRDHSGSFVEEAVRRFDVKDQRRCLLATYEELIEKALCCGNDKTIGQSFTK